MSITIIAEKKRPRFFSRKSTGDIVFDIFNYVFLIFISFTILYPFWNLFLLSFSSTTDITSLGFHFWIKNWHVDAYKFAFKQINILSIYFNSIFRTAVGTVAIVLCTLIAAYPLSKKDLPGRNVITVYILITMFFGGGLIPTYLVIRSLGLIDSRWVLILPLMTQGFYIIIMRNFMMTIDKAYEESAFMDGANYIQILIRIIVPLSKPVIATIALWSAVLHWNSWFDALIYINSQSKIVLQLLLRRLVIEAEQNFIDMMNKFVMDEGRELPSASVKATVTIITIGPIVLVYPFLQKYFIKGIFLGSLKG